MCGTCTDTIVWVPAPWVLGGTKRSNIIKSESQKQFQRFLNQTWCIFLQMKDILHIRREFHSAAWVIPRGGTWGTVGGGLGDIFFFFKIQPDLVCELLT